MLQGELWSKDSLALQNFLADGLAGWTGVQHQRSHEIVMLVCHRKLPPIQHIIWSNIIAQDAFEIDRHFYIGEIKLDLSILF